MNELAIIVDDTINNSGVKRIWLCKQLGISQPYLYKLLHKKSFNVADANRILEPLGHKVKVSYKVEKVQ